MTSWKRVRDSITGRFVKREEARTRPESTVTENVAHFVTPKPPIGAPSTEEVVTAFLNRWVPQSDHGPARIALFTVLATAAGRYLTMDEARAAAKDQPVERAIGGESELALDELVQPILRGVSAGADSNISLENDEAWKFRT